MSSYNLRPRSSYSSIVGKFFCPSGRDNPSTISLDMSKLGIPSLDREWRSRISTGIVSEGYQKI
jgi:hypothetical protein